MGDRDVLSEVSKTIDILYRHSRAGYIELRFLHQQTGRIRQEWYDCSAEDVIEAISRDVERAQDRLAPVNVYIGRALRNRRGGSKAEDVSILQAISFDLDPVRKAKGSPSTDSERDITIRAAHGLRDGYLSGAGCIVSSGNGAQILCPLDRPGSGADGCRAVERGHRELERECRKYLTANPEYSASTVLDAQYDIPRIIKLPGSMSRKGVADETHPHRRAMFLPELQGVQDLQRAYNLDTLIALGKSSDDRQPGGCIHEIPAAGSIPSRFWIMLRRDRLLAQSWVGTRADLPSGDHSSSSEQDMALVSRLKILGFTSAEAKKILISSPISKARYREDYANMTVGKCYGY